MGIHRPEFPSYLSNIITTHYSMPVCGALDYVTGIVYAMFMETTEKAVLPCSAACLRGTYHSSMGTYSFLPLMGYTSAREPFRRSLQIVSRSRSGASPAHI